MMIHRPMSSAIGTAEELQKQIEVLDKIQTQLVEIYVKKTGQLREQIENWMSGETWFVGQEAVDAGFADEVVSEKSTLSATIDMARWVPSAVLAKCRAPVQRLIGEMLRGSRGVKEARTSEEREQQWAITASAAERFLEKPGVTSTDMCLVERIIRTTGEDKKRLDYCDLVYPL